MKTHTLLKHVAPLMIGGMLLSPMLALGAGGTEVTMKPVGATASTTAGAISPKEAARLQAAKDKADKEVDRRIQSLTDLAARVEATQRVTAEFKQKLATNVQNHLAGLTQLKSKIDADADLETLKTDIKTITESYRIYMLVLPQARIAAAADREITLITMLNQLGAKLQAKVSAAQSAGANMTAPLAALADMSAKLTDANAQAQAAVTASGTLAPDAGDKTKMTQNAAALKTARADILASQKDLIAARKDVDLVLKGLKSSAASSTASTTQTH